MLPERTSDAAPVKRIFSLPELLAAQLPEFSSVVVVPVFWVFVGPVFLISVVSAVGAVFLTVAPVVLAEQPVFLTVAPDAVVVLVA